MERNQKAQGSLEYLMTYGWALVLIITIVSILAFIVGEPASVAFSSGDPTKFLVKGGSVIGENAEIMLQNVTGGKIEITEVIMTSNYSTENCTLNQEAMPPRDDNQSIAVSAGGEMRVECGSVAGNGSGTISINYTDHAGLQRSVDIMSSSTGTAGLCDDKRVNDLDARAKSGQVQLAWTHTAPDSYNIYRGTESGSHSLIGNTNSTYSAYLDDNLINDINYYYVVKSLCGETESPASNEVMGNPTDRDRRRR